MSDYQGAIQRRLRSFKDEQSPMIGAGAYQASSPVTPVTPINNNNSAINRHLYRGRAGRDFRAGLEAQGINRRDARNALQTLDFFNREKMMTLDPARLRATDPNAPVAMGDTQGYQYQRAAKFISPLTNPIYSNVSPIQELLRRYGYVQ